MTLWHITKKGSPDEPPYIQMCIKVKSQWSEVERIVVRMLWPVKFDVPFIR